MLTLPFRRLGRRGLEPVVAQAPSIRVRLPDGRTIAVEEYGDPAGPVVLYFHGWPASRLEAGLIGGLPVRLLSFDRPGYGRSTPQPGRSLLDFTSDVAFVADCLGLGPLHLVGMSGGAPYAAACAYALQDRVRGLALVSPVPPSAGIPNTTPGIGHLFRLGRHPRLARRLFALLRPLVRQRIITPSTVIGKDLPPADRAFLTRATMAALGRVWREGFGRGIEGALSDAEIYAIDWAVPLDRIRVPTSIWFGSEDSLIPRWALAPYESIPGARWHVLPNEGHYSLALRHASLVLDELLALPVLPQLSNVLSR